MKEIKFITIMLCCFVVIRTNAQQQVSLSEAKNAAVEAVKSRFNEKDCALSSIKTVNILQSDNKDTLLYEVIFSDGKTILLSGSKACFPILGHYMSKSLSIFDSSRMTPCCLQAFVREYAAQVAWAFADKAMPLYYHEEWDDWQSHNPMRSATTVGVEPLTTSKWGQWVSNDYNSDTQTGDCTAYNYYVDRDSRNCDGCPTDKCPVGCVAVAMGQIMYYWKYPVYLSNKAYQYDWCNMPDALNSGRNNYAQERNAVARLLKDCAESVNALYCVGHCQTSALILSARYALENDFYYSDDINWELRSSHTLNNWKNKIKANLDNKRPVLYQSPGTRTDGHAFICDGYNSHDEFHFNWGHNSADYGWFALNAIEFDNSTGHHNYNYAQEAVFDIYPNPNNTQNYCNYYMPLWAHYYLYYNVQGNTFPPPYLNVPKTFAILESVDESMAQQLPAPATWHTIPAGGVSEYVAHKEIRLLPGFHAEAGSYFRAHIEPCAGCSEVQSSSMLNNPINPDGFSGTSDMLPPLKQGYSVATDRFQEEEPANVKLYPNPNSGIFTIETNFDPLKVTTVQIYNSLGQLTYSQAGLLQAAITVPGLNKGLFVVKITTATNQFMHKMVVQ
ncbi:MAG: C10 family peptidase [Bacteroidales bacterium]|jgi:hypothetical protein|nr:C10 family peptidase [Bacteroidales bacterium]